MKGKLKKMIMLGLAGAVALGATVGLVGCNDKVDNAFEDNELRTIISNKNVYIVVNENGTETLHKGDVINKGYYMGNYTGYALLPTILKFNCGKELQTYQFVAYTQGCPTKDKYDKVCDCAYELTFQDDALNSQNHIDSHESHESHELTR